MKNNERWSQIYLTTKYDKIDWGELTLKGLKPMWRKENYERGFEDANRISWYKKIVTNLVKEIRENKNVDNFIRFETPRVIQKKKGEQSWNKGTR